MRRHPSTLRMMFIIGSIIALQAPPIADAAQSFRTRTSTTDLITVEGLENDVRAEIEFGRELAAIILGQNKFDNNRRINHYLNLVGSSITRQSQRPELKFSFALLDTEEVNAYTAPGGYIFVTKGALRLMRDEAELAAVLAHEIAHTTQKHIVNELKIKGKDTSTQGGLSKIIGGFGDTARIAVNQALEKASALLFTKGLKKEDEYEADQIGALLLTSSGYDPTALHRYLSRIKSIKKENRAVLYKTHPSFDSRLKRLEILMAEETLTSSDAPTYKKRFNQNIRVK